MPSRSRPILAGLIRAALIFGILMALPFFIAKYFAEMTGDRR